MTDQTADEAREHLRAMAFDLATSGGLVEPRAFDAALDAYRDALLADAPAVQAPAADPATPSRRAGLRDEIANALEAADYGMDMRRGDLADAVLPVLYREWPWLRAEAEDAASAEPAADRTTLRDRIRRAVCGAEGFDWDSDMLEPDEYGDHADAVLAVLPAPTDQAAELERLRTENARMRHELEVMYGGAFDSLKATPTDRTDEPGESR